MASIHCLKIDRVVVDRDTGTHGRRQGHLANVDTFRRGRLGLLEVSQHSNEVAFDGIRLKTHLADAAVDYAILVLSLIHI